MQTPREKVLLSVRMKRGAHRAVPPTGGKSRRGWGEGRRRNSKPRITFKPRPHSTIGIGEFTFDALVDGGGVRDIADK